MARHQRLHLRQLGICSPAKDKVLTGAMACHDKAALWQASLRLFYHLPLQCLDIRHPDMFIPTFETRVIAMLSGHDITLLCLKAGVAFKQC